VAWLREQLIDGPWVRKELWREARGLGFAQRTVYRALHEIGAVAVAGGREGKYVLLKEQAARLPTDSFSRGMDLERLADERAMKAVKRKMGAEVGK
jgi:hypothetical protein